MKNQIGGEGKNTRFLSWILAIIWAAAIFYFSSIPNPPQPFTGDELFTLILTTTEHVIEYFILGFLLFHAFKENRRRSLEKAFTLAILAAFIYAITDEIHQYFVPGRMADIRDLTADYIGAMIGAYVGSLLSKQK